MRVNELSTIMDILRAFFIINHKKGITDSKNKGLYKTYIKYKIQAVLVLYVGSGDKNWLQRLYCWITVENGDEKVHYIRNVHYRRIYEFASQYIHFLIFSFHCKMSI